MDPIFEELVGVNSDRAFYFFFGHLHSIVEEKKFRLDELKYVTSILAHYAQVSRFAERQAPPTSLSEVFDNFVANDLRRPLRDLDMLECGGSQVVLLAGFFRHWMAKRHNVEWYDGIGQSIFGRIGRYSEDIRRREFFSRFEERLPSWNRACSRMHKKLQEERYLIKL